MRKIREVLRLKWALGLTDRAIARSCGISRSTVAEYIGRAGAAGLSWPLPEGLDEAGLFGLLFPVPERPAGRPTPEPDWPAVHKELKRKGVTLQLLWEEYRRLHPAGYGRSRYCALYRAWAGKLEPTMRMKHVAGEAYPDYAGMTLTVIDPATHEPREAQVFVMALGASSYTYAEAQWSQTLADWLGGHERAFSEFGGVPAITVPDNLKSAVTTPCRYEPDLNPTYQAFAEHYGTAVVPARVRRPRDKAKVETAVGVVERRVLAVLRDTRLEGLAGANAAIRALVAEVNDQPLRYIGQSRRELLETLDRPGLLPLPERAFEYGVITSLPVATDYHFVFEDHFYSVPDRLIRQTVEVRATAQTLEVFHGGVRVATHLRSGERGASTTLPEHMPEGHRAFAVRSPEHFVQRAELVGPHTTALITHVLASRKHPQLAYRTCSGILSLTRTFEIVRIEAATARALNAGITSFKGVKHILKTGLDRVPLGEPDPAPLPAHANVRGSEYYSQ